METAKNPKKINRITDATLKKKTGKSWQAWITILNSANAHHLSHQQIADYLFNQHKLDSWWTQIITVGYEQHQGKRERYQKPDGYEISISKTIHTTPSTLYHAWINEEVRKTWLSESITIHKTTFNKSIRITWIDEVTNLNVDLRHEVAWKGCSTIPRECVTEPPIPPDEPRILNKERIRQ